MPESPHVVAFLFTQDLRGDLRFLPKLARVLMHLRRDDRRTLTVDLGGMCTPDVWHCAATEGRSMLIALDGLNYAAVNAEGLSESVRPYLTKSLIYMQAIDAAHAGTMDQVRFVTRLSPDDLPPQYLTLVVAPHAEAKVTATVIEFPAIARYKVGRMRVRMNTPVELVSLETFDVPDDTAPDATISGMVDFIESEARQYQKRQDQK